LKTEISSFSEDAKRLEALNSYHILDTLEEKDYDDLTALAAAICGVPIALISLVDKDLSGLNHIEVWLPEKHR